MSRLLLRSLAPAAFCLFLVGFSDAAKVKVWYHAGQSHHEKAQLKQAVVTSEGALRLSRQVKAFAGLQATHIWAIVEDKAGNLFVATGDDGKIFKVAADGKVTVAYTSTDSQVLSLALAEDGTLFAGTGPHGLIVSIPPQGNPKILAADLDSYVWNLVIDAAGKNLYAGTGPKGRIYQVSPEGKASVFYSTKQEHILCLSRGADNVLYAGTDKGGLVYRIDPNGKGFVLYDAHQGEIRSLLVTGNGIYAGTSAPVPRGARGIAASSSSTAVSSVDRGSDEQPAANEQPTAQKGGAKKKLVRTDSTSPTESSTEESSSGSRNNGTSAEENTSSRGTGASAGSPPGTGENSIYRIAADGTVRELFRDKVMVLSLLQHDGRLFAGTGMRGQLFEINEADKERTEIARLDNGQIQCLFQRRDGSIVLGAGDPAKLYVLEDSFASSGTITSEVLDARIISKWGALTWKAHTPAGTTVRVAVRSGNVAEPDQTWTDWSAEETDPVNGRVTVRMARYLQYRVTLSTENLRVTPELNSLAIRYKNINQAPEITNLEVPDLAAANLDHAKKLKIKWSATDPNEDELTFNVYVRKDGWKDWVLVEEDLEKKEFEWDTTTFPSGHYQLKVVASDRRDNAAEDALTARRTSARIPVAHVPPKVEIKVTGMDGEKAVIEGTATDPMVRLTEASFALNGKRWSNVFPTDGLFDSKTESFRFTTGRLRPGTYVLILRVRDAAGNVGSGDVVFTVRERTGAR
jgi:hypothetical protein